MSPPRVVVVGYGMAGSKVVEQVRARSAGVPVTVFGAEPYAAYNRVLLSEVLAGRTTAEDIRLAIPTGDDAATTVRTGVAVTRLDRARRVVIADDGSRTPYDVLVLATGSRPVVPPVAGLLRDAPAEAGGAGLIAGAAVFRTVDDCRTILATARSARRAVVLGGGLLGLEAARGLAARGLDVEVVQVAGHLMDRQLDPDAGRVLTRILAALGVRVRVGARATAVVGTDRLRGVRLADGTVLDADLLVLACGVRPEVTLARAAGLAVDAGVVVDDTMRSVTDREVYAVGECAQHGGQVYGLVAPAWEQAAVVADRISGAAPAARYAGSRVVTRLKAAGIDLAAMGRTDLGDDDAEVVRFCDPARGTYKKLVIRDERLVGAIMLGDISTVGTVTQLFDRGAPVPPDRLRLLFEPRPGVAGGLAPPGAGGAPAAGASGDGASGDGASGDGASGDGPGGRAPAPGTTVCQCNGVTAGTIAACWRGGARTVEAIAGTTRATTGCGGCRDQVAGIVAQLATSTDRAGASGGGGVR